MRKQYLERIKEQLADRCICAAVIVVVACAVAWIATLMFAGRFA